MIAIASHASSDSATGLTTIRGEYPERSLGNTFLELLPTQHSTLHMPLLGCLGLGPPALPFGPLPGVVWVALSARTFRLILVRRVDLSTARESS